MADSKENYLWDLWAGRVRTLYQPIASRKLQIFDRVKEGLVLVTLLTWATHRYAAGNIFSVHNWTKSIESIGLEIAVYKGKNPEGKNWWKFFLSHSQLLLPIIAHNFQCHWCFLDNCRPAASSAEAWESKQKQTSMWFGSTFYSRNWEIAQTLTIENW